MSGGGGGRVQISPGERALADLAESQWKDFKRRGVPIENEFIRSVRGLRNQKDIAAGAGNANTWQAFDGVSKQVRQQQFAAGAKAGSGRQTLKDNEVAMSRSKSASKNVTSSAQDSTNRYLTGLAKAIAYGRGLSDQANLGFRGAADVSAQNARTDALYEAEKHKQNMQLAGTVIGAAGSIAANGGFSDMGNQAKVLSGAKYNTGFMSEQSRMLAEQERGMF